MPAIKTIGDMGTLEINSLEDFEAVCRIHDLTYSYSDDHAYYQRGTAEYNRIRKAAEKLPREDVERIWNRIVDEKLVPMARSQFYWKWPAEARLPDLRCDACGNWIELGVSFCASCGSGRGAHESYATRI